MKFSKRLLYIFLSALILITAIPLTAAAVDETKLRNRVVGYFPSYRYSAVDSIDFSAMSHVILSFINYKDDGFSCGFTDSQIRTIREKCNESGTKLLMSLGGADGFTYKNNPIDTAEERTYFVNYLKFYVDKYELDGIDIDVEITNRDFWLYYEPFISELSAELKPEGKLLTMAVAPYYCDWIQVSTYDYFDFINLMSYDAIDKIPNMILYYKARGVSDDKMTVGVPFFGTNEKGAAYTYAEIIADNKAELSQKGYYNGFTYDGIPSITAKSEFSLSYGGIMIWEVGQDCFEPEYSLLNAIKNVYTVPETDVAPVTELAASNTKFTGTTLSWKASADAVKYDVYNGMEYIGSTEDVSYRVSGLDMNSIYTLKVFAVDVNGVRSISANVNVQTPMDASEFHEWDSKTAYLKGDYVVYNGDVFMAQWWTRGVVPGSLQSGASAWLYVGKAGSFDGGSINGSILLMKRGVNKGYKDGVIFDAVNYGGEAYAVPQSVNGSYALPIRFISESFGMSVEYLGSGKTKIINSNGEYIVVTKGSTNILKYNADNSLVADFNAEFAVYSIPAESSSITYVPMRAVGEALGLGVRYVSGAESGVGMSYVAVSDDALLEQRREAVNAEIAKAYEAGLK